MPCMQCSSGKWKWGNTGRCIYLTKAECEAKNKEVQSKDLTKEGKIEQTSSNQ